MTEEEIRERINGIIEEKLYVDREFLVDEARMNSDLGADSLDVVDLTVHLEDVFGIHFDDRDTEVMYNCALKDLYGLVRSKLEENRYN